MRSSKRSDLRRVCARFAVWRRGPRRHAIPEHLWRAAVALVDRYGSSTICRQLGLNPSSFKRMRLALGGSVVEERGSPRRKSRGGASPAQAEGLRRGSARVERGEAGSRRGAFFELPPLGLAVRPALGSPVSVDIPSLVGECRFVVDGAGGTRLTIVLARADVAVIAAVCRSVLGGAPFSDQAAP